MFEKTDWSLAPDWARFRAQDADGRWYWYKTNPPVGDRGWKCSGNRSRFIALAEPNNDWRNTLQQRPD